MINIVNSFLVCICSTTFKNVDMIYRSSFIIDSDSESHLRIESIVRLLCLFLTCFYNVLAVTSFWKIIARVGPTPSPFLPPCLEVFYSHRTSHDLSALVFLFYFSLVVPPSPCFVPPPTPPRPPTPPTSLITAVPCFLLLWLATPSSANHQFYPLSAPVLTPVFLFLDSS